VSDCGRFKIVYEQIGFGIWRATPVCNESALDEFASAYRELAEERAKNLCQRHAWGWLS
jgi:hypothetical protein